MKGCVNYTTLVSENVCLKELDKITFKLKETWKKYLKKIEKHQTNNNKPYRNKDG